MRHRGRASKVPIGAEDENPCFTMGRGGFGMFSAFWKPAKFWWLAAILVLGLGALGGVGPATGAPNGQELRVRLVNDIYDVDPARIRDTEDYAISREIYSSLVRYNSAKPGGVEPDLAERYEVSADGLVYTFWLHKGVKWHKGYGNVAAKIGRAHV